VLCTNVSCVLHTWNGLILYGFVLHLPEDGKLSLKYVGELICMDIL
jgi:hypothetical protein